MLLKVKCLVISEKSNKNLVSEQTNFQTVGTTCNFVKTIENIPLLLQSIRAWNCLKQDILVPFDVCEYRISSISNIAAVIKNTRIKSYVKSSFKQLVK
jgi:hypothetical protein